MKERIINERGLVFSTEMVQAIAGGRKTQTRRIYKPKMGEECDRVLFDNFDMFYEKTKEGYFSKSFKCPYGKVGDLLYVKETHAFQEEDDYDGYVVYKASEKEPQNWFWSPSLFMPKRYARFFLKITDIRVERLQDITEEDAMAEGVKCLFSLDAIDKYQQLWERINGEGSWASNPWVWVIGFNVRKDLSTF
jgi:hypothetical protein